MSPFRFRFSTVLSLRQRREEQLRIELAQIRQRHDQESLQLQHLDRTRESALRDAFSVRTGRVNAEEAGSWERYLFSLEERIAAQKHLVGMTEREAERKLQEVVAATQDTRAMEKLKENYADAHRRNELREEQKFLDELASIRAARV